MLSSASIIIIIVVVVSPARMPSGYCLSAVTVTSLTRWLSYLVSLTCARTWWTNSWTSTSLVANDSGVHDYDNYLQYRFRTPSDTSQYCCHVYGLRFSGSLSLCLAVTESGLSRLASDTEDNATVSLATNQSGFVCCVCIVKRRQKLVSLSGV